MFHGIESKTLPWKQGQNHVGPPKAQGGPKKEKEKENPIILNFPKLFFFFRILSPKHKSLIPLLLGTIFNCIQISRKGNPTSEWLNIIREFN
jgi:hypothetical protein